MMEQFNKYTTFEPCSYTVTISSHAPEHYIIDLDHPTYGTTVVKCGGRKFDLEVVRKALALAAELGGALNNG